MRTTLAFCRGDDEACGQQRSIGRVGWMKRLLWLRASPSGGVHTDTEPGVWLRSFQLLDTDGQHEDPVQEWGEEEEDGAIFGVTLRREPTPPGSDSPDLSPAFGCVQYHTVKVRRLKAATLERLVSHLLDPERQEADFIHVFLSMHRAFTSTGAFIELLFQRDESLTKLDNAVSRHSPALPVVRLWLEEYSNDFQEPPQYQTLRLLCTHLRRRLCFRRLFQSAEALLKRLQEQDGSRSSSQHLGESLQCSDQSHGGEPSSKQDKHNFLDFPVRDVAEQLTRLDAELFVKVVPFHCLGCVWSQRDKKENRNLAPTVRATISQFNAVTNRVISSLLCPSSPGPSTSSPVSSPAPASTFLYPPSAPGSPRCSHTSPVHRARVIEWWIAVAQECRELKNFSSLKAILSALQSNAVYRLKRTWAAVSRESTIVFDQLCETFPDENCVLTNGEIPVESFGCGVVPYLGTYLTVLTMLDTALTDTVEGRLINFEKRRREYEILSQIRQLQAFCSRYSLSVNSSITAWLQAQTLLTDQESYEMSRELEPPVDPCPNSPNSWSRRLLANKLASLRTSHSDQISVSSSGSSGSDLEDLSIPHLSPLRLKLKSLPGSLHNVTEDFSMSSSSSPSLSSSSCSSSQPDLSCSSLTLSPESSSSSSSSSRSTCSPQAVLPLYNKQIADSCIIRVTVECVSNGNVYKSILLTSQDHTPQVIHRALEKHNMEDFRSSDFGLYQLLNHGRELHIPDNANVFYAMCTSANYDFVLRQRWRSHSRQFGSFSSPGARPRGRHIK
ncbi:ral guanine nucleotide dissociation stimulator-like 1 isoform X1 [Fundulus heteroclitus]|uniref:ral guanine nucleotide dissociation stimulator-like 1 isoform X1 n=1 Tax=Fundulus heteroclitus TaxID=8078 RepID=UPI00165B6B6C|nr:ral guanine nucleotide dissociation stimulator-like 1 isoform X1 [Fundulus heteroclitus]XP_012725682.2 ral guanine nucleotide dissociation stimulator-like 1 isoform X1 [Fundulus heteroclitus]XP_021175973.2 ral guanine nucleotide dissociation stimulator-like 1 isoform X1 [Fundulus heteroclitus]XP_021175975.2 ral guanine nucleotide dissociation stimulator-like 1 isoform X1 [Fundulus heteroclitus]